MNYKIVLVSPGQPSLNPRLVKEADALSAAGYEVIVFYAYWSQLGAQLDKSLLKTKKWRAFCVGGNPNDKRMIYFFSRILFRSAKFIAGKTASVLFLSNMTIARASFALIRAVKRQKADLYIAHNLGALPAVVKAAERNGGKSGFDAEDFHRQEISDDINSRHFQIAKSIEDRYIPHLNYMSASSPMIGEAYHQLYPAITPITVLNVFDNKNPVRKGPIDQAAPVRLFWFSQTIGRSRGLVHLAKALQSLNEKDFELHLLGYITPGDKEFYIENELLGLKNVVFHDPLEQDRLIDYASQFDIGLALEPGFCRNNNMALSNKLFTYLQAGLAIIASDTPAQQTFFIDHPQIGTLYNKKSVSSLIEVLTWYQSDRKRISEAADAALKLGLEKMNWQNGSKIFLNKIKKVLDSN